MHFTVFYNGQFWVGVALQQSSRGLKAMEHVFGPEPSLQEIYQFVNTELFQIFKAAPVADMKQLPPRLPKSPKRAAGMAAREMKSLRKINRAYEAIRLTREAGKKDRQMRSKKAKREELLRRREISRLKAKEKRKGH